MILTKVKDLIPAPKDGSDGKDAPNLGENLLRQTQFVSELMDQWYTATGEIITNGFDGHNVCHFIVSQTLGQYVQGSGHEILMPATVYTISFWSKGVIFIDINPGDTGEAYAVYDRAFGRWIDGVKESDYVNDFGYIWEDSDWTYHTYTFKTAAAFDGSLANLYWHSPSWNSASTGCWLCMPKLERGDKATAWCLSEKDKIGASITKQSETYRYATNNTGVCPASYSSDWQPTRPTLQKGYWLFTETTITWSDNSKTVLYTSERNPNDGISGQDIIVDRCEVTYALTQSNQQPADSDFGTYPSSLTQGWWLWSKSTTYYKKASTSESAGSSSNYSVSYIAQDGNGGRGITSIVEYYKASSNATGETAPNDDSGWSTNPNTAMQNWNQTNKYLWNYEKVTYSSGTTVERSTPTVIAIWTKDGAAGKGIDSIQNYYKITNSLTPPDKPSTPGTDGWDDDPIAPTAQDPYLWNYEVITWVNPSTTTSTDVQMIGHFGKDGISVRAQYSADGSSWHDTFTSGDKWMRTSTDNGTTWSSAIKIVGENGKETVYSFGISQYETTADANTAPSDISTWNDAPVAVTTQKPYLWAKVEQKNSSGTTTSTKYVRFTGTQGPKGDDVFSVSLDRSSLTCETSDGDFTQDYVFYITIYAYYGSTDVLSACTVTATGSDGDIYVDVMDDKRVRVRAYEGDGLAAVAPVTINVSHATYGSRTLVCNITRVERGKRGKAGPQLRGPQLYSAVPSNFQFFKGADYEEFVDVVIDDNGNYYKCKQSHIKSSGVGPGTAGWENYWSLGTKFDIVATQILLATYALIKNLGVENVEAKDANNNTIFSVRNGVLVCNGGTIGGFKISSSRIGAEDVDVNNFLWIESNGKMRIVRTGSGNALDVLGNIILNGNGGTFTLNNASNNGTIQLVGRLKADTGYLKTSSDTLNSGDIYRDANGYLRIKT